MPLTGTLRDLSLPNLVQVQCSEQNQTRVLLTRGAHKGTLIFANCELVYASADNLAGENAVYELLTWEEGDFRVDDATSPPERNVTIPWSALLIEGLRRADEARAERDGLLEARLRDLKGKQGVRGAFVVRPNGTIRADAKGETLAGDPAALIQVYANAERIQELLSLSAPRQIVLSNPTEKIWVQKLQDDFCACWLDSRASIESIKTTLQTLGTPEEPK
ncbi:MAG: DUF4388 domain-containing protein [Chloroflexi bacterium]|nr:DUF4388 domain-containing protein [Chloroflexota bacterium]